MTIGIEMFFYNIGCLMVGLTIVYLIIRNMITICLVWMLIHQWPETSRQVTDMSHSTSMRHAWEIID